VTEKGYPFIILSSLVFPLSVRVGLVCSSTSLYSLWITREKNQRVCRENALLRRICWIVSGAVE
jgi:hypothetical protein